MHIKGPSGGEKGRTPQSKDLNGQMEQYLYLMMPDGDYQAVWRCRG